MNRSPVQKHASLLACCVLLAAPFLVFLDVTLGNAQFYGDSTLQDFPLRFYLGRWLSRGYVPLWAAELNFGHPFLAEIHTGVLYPPNWFFSLIAYHCGLRWWQIDGLLHVALSGLLFFAYLRAEGHSVTAGLLASLCFAFSAPFMVHIGHNSYLHSLSWTGLILYGFSRMSRKPGAGSALALSSGLLMSWYAGSPPVLFMHLVLGFACGLRLFLTPGSRRRMLANPRFMLRAGAVLLLSFVLPALFLYAQVAPLADLSGRHDWDRIMYFGFHSKLRSFWHLLWSQWFEYAPDPGHAEFAGSIGPAGFLLALISVGVGLRGRFTGPVIFWSLLIAVGLIFSHALNPVYEFVFDHVPGFGNFRAPGRYILFVTVGLASLAAVGLDAVKQGLLRSRRVAVLFALVLLLGTLAPFYKNSEHMPPGNESFFLFFPDLLAVCVSAGLILVLVSVCRTPGSDRPAYLLFAALLVWCLAVNAFFQLRIVAEAPPTFATGNADVHCQSGWSRCLPVTGIAAWDSNRALLGSVWQGTGYLTLETARQYEFKVSLFGDRFASEDTLQLTAQQIAAASLMSAPRAYFTNCPVIVAEPPEILEALQDRAEHGRCPLYLEGDARAEHNIVPGTAGCVCQPLQVSMPAGPNQMQVRIGPDHPAGYIYVSQTYFPGWRAEVDGRRATVRRANYLFLAVPTPAKATRLRLERRPHFTDPTRLFGSR